MATIESEIVDALFASVTDFTNSLSPVLPVSFQGVGGEPANSDIWLTASHIPNETQNYAIDNGVDFLGILQISVTLLNGAGIVNASEIAGKVAEYYNKGKRLGPVKSYRRPSLAPPIEAEGKIYIPVTIYYRGFYYG